MLVHRHRGQILRSLVLEACVLDCPRNSFTDVRRSHSVIPQDTSPGAISSDPLVLHLITYHESSTILDFARTLSTPPPLKARQPFTSNAPIFKPEFRLNLGLPSKQHSWANIDRQPHLSPSITNSLTTTPLPHSCPDTEALDRAISRVLSKTATAARSQQLSQVPASSISLFNSRLNRSDARHSSQHLSVQVSGHTKDYARVHPARIRARTEGNGV